MPTTEILQRGLGRLKQTKILVNDNTQVTVQKIKSDARQMAASGKIACIMVDYLTLLDMPEKSRNDLSVAEVTKQLTRLAKELNCVVVLLCQLNRENMKRANKRPIKSDLRESGQIEQDAAYILFPYRDLQFNPDSPAGNYAELILDKNRFGATGVAYAQFFLMAFGMTAIRLRLITLAEDLTNEQRMDLNFKRKNTC